MSLKDSNDLLSVSGYCLKNHGFFFFSSSKYKTAITPVHLDVIWSSVLPESHLVPSSWVLCMFLFLFSSEFNFNCIAMTPRCSIRHYKRQIAFPEAKVLLSHCPLLVWRVYNPKWALEGLGPSWWQRRLQDANLGGGRGGSRSHRVADSIQMHQ